MSRVLAVVLLSAFSVVAQTKHPFTFEDMMALKRVEEPQVSPDGKWVLFAAVDVDLKANTKTPHVWVVPLDSNQNTAGVTHSSPVLARVGNENTPRVPHPSLVLARVGDADKQKAGSSTSVGVTASREREIISDQDADRPRWAPDGKRFAFVSTKENGSQIWIADFDAATGTVTGTHRLTNIATEASGELWSPDGKNILFKSDVYPECDGTPESEAACNVKKLDEVKNSKVKAQIFTHLLYRHWSAYKEGKRTHLFLIPVDGCTAAHVGPGALIRAGEPRSPSVEQGSTGRVGATTPTRDGEGSGLCGVARDLTPGDYDAPMFSLGGQDNYAFSPDGQEICYASNHDPEPAISTNNDLFTVPVNVNSGSGGTGVSPVQATPAQVLAATKNITAENKAADNTPLYSPDGKYIAYRAQQRPGYESDLWRLMLYERKTGEKLSLTERFDRWVGTFAWQPDSTAVFFGAERAGQLPIYRLSVAGDGTRKSTHGEVELAFGAKGYKDDLAVTPDGRTLVFTEMSVGYPVGIYAGSIESFREDVWLRDFNAVCGGKDLKDCSVLEAIGNPLVHLNDSVLSQVSMSPLETFWFTGADNDKVQGWLIKPPNFDPNKKYPVKFIIHGGPEVPLGDEWSYRWNFELFAANGYVVIFINFHGSPGYGQKFIDAINGDWGGAPFEDLMKGLDYAEQHYPFIDKDRECALGGSYGGYMTNWILGHTNRFKCIVTHDGMFNPFSAWGTTEELWFNEWEFKGTPWTNRELYRKWSPHLSAANFKTPTLVIHGQLDYRLDVSEGFQLFTTLQRLGVPSKMLYFPDEGHWVLKPQNSQLWYKTVNDWVDQWVRK
jgi:dipeptidyl aminopeptidase/acylaminoacyl peptidase